MIKVIFLIKILNKIINHIMCDVNLLHEVIFILNCVYGLYNIAKCRYMKCFAMMAVFFVW